MLAEYQNLGQRVGAEAIGAIDADTGAFASGIKAVDPGRRIDAGVDPAHGVMHHRAYRDRCVYRVDADIGTRQFAHHRSEEHTSELQSLMRISYAVFCLKK